MRCSPLWSAGDGLFLLFGDDARGRVHPAAGVVPVAVEAVHELVAEGGEALQVALAARRRRVERAHARRALRRRLHAVRAAEDVEEVLAARERLAHRVRLLDPVPDHRDTGSWVLAG